MHKLFIDAKVPTPDVVLLKCDDCVISGDKATINDAEKRAEYISRLEALISASSEKGVLFAKLDDGFDSAGGGLLRGTAEQILDKSLAVCAGAASADGAPHDVVVQPFLSGREWTVAVANGRAFAGIRNNFASGELFKPPGGCKGGESVET
jgi:hypothetical protein